MSFAFLSLITFFQRWVSVPLPNFSVKVLLEAEDNLAKTLAYARAQLESFGDVGVREAGRLGSAFEVLGSALSRALGIAFYQAGAYLQDFLRGSIQAFTEFEAAATRLASLSASAGESVNMLAQAFRAAASAAAREMSVSGAEAMRALEALVKAGLSGADALQALRYSLALARIEGEEYGKAASNLVQVMAQFGVEGSRAAVAVDVLVNASRLGIGSATDFAQGLANVGSTARAMGMSLQETTAWLVALERRLGSAEEAGTQLSRLFINLYEVAAKLGVPVRDSADHLRTASEIMLDVIARVRELGGDFEALQSRLAGVDARAVKALFTLSQMNESFTELVAGVSEAGTALRTFEEYLGTAEGRAAALRAETDRLQRMVGESLSAIYYMVGPYVLKAFDAVATAWRGIIAAAVDSRFDQRLAYIETQLRILGRISEEEASSFIRSWVEMGDISLEEGLKIAEAVAIYDENIQALVERARVAGVEVPESFRQMADAVGGAVAESVSRMSELNLALGRVEQAVKDLGLASKGLAAGLDFYNVLKQVHEALGVAEPLTQEQAKSMEYLAAAQSVVNYTSQLLSLQQQALQLYMMGATEAGNMLTAMMQGLAQALADGNITQSEFIGLLGTLGVNAGNVAGSLHEMLVKALETTRQAVEGNVSSVQSLINYLNTLNGQVVRYTIVEEHVTIHSSTGGTSGSGIVHETGGRFFEEYQRGAWYVPRTGPAILHEGEMVLPRAVAEWFRRGGATTVVNVNMSVNFSGERGADAAEVLSRELVRRLRAAL
uniref:Phage tail tape measure protein n=3 Tax=Caldiarchaeum subterraneum TaxID=311458 RepID=A0A7C4I5Q6_CALS0